MPILAFEPLEDALDALENSADMELFVIIGTVVVILVLIQTVGGMVRGVSQERTRREIAAYIAEGSMTPEQGERLLAARSDADGSNA